MSAALSPKGNPAKIINLLADNDEIHVYYCTEIITEYTEVLSRSYLKIASETQNSIIDSIKKVGVQITPSCNKKALIDVDDQIFYDTASTIGAILITGNSKHYPKEKLIMNPTDFLNMFKNE